VELLQVSHRAALSGLYQLEEAGVLRRAGTARRDQLFHAPEIIERLNQP